MSTDALTALTNPNTTNLMKSQLVFGQLYIFTKVQTNISKWLIKTLIFKLASDELVTKKRVSE